MPHIVISGGAKGIGLACCRLFEAQGIKVTSLYKNTIPDKTDLITPIKCDVSDPDDAAQAIIKAHDLNGPVDCLISNAGISVKGLTQDFGFDDYRKVMDTNFGGLFNLANAVIPEMVSRKSGVILAVSSMWGQTGASCEALYSASKGAVDAYIKSLAKELGPSGIRVNAVSPGVIDTDMMNGYSDEDKTELADETPLGRLGTPEDVARTLLYLSSDEASFITGQIIGVNGGFLI